MIWTAFVFGFLMSAHCVSMCGPFVAILPFHSSSKWRGGLQFGMYHLGRVLTYVLLGLAFGFLGKGLFLAGFQQNLSILVGIAMIVFAISNSNMLYIPILNPLIRELKLKMTSIFRAKTSFKFLLIGIFNGLLPCGLVYVALFGALAAADFRSSMLYMLFFGLGTIPSLLLVRWVKAFSNRLVFQRIQKAFPIFVCTVGLLFILRGLGLAIPFVSPSDANLKISNNANSCPTVMVK